MNSWIDSKHNGSTQDHSISCCGRDRMVVGFTTPYAFSAHHHWSCEFELRSWRGVVDLVYSIQCYVIKFVNDLRQVAVVLWVLWFPQPIMILLFIDNLAVVLSFLTLQDKHNTCTLSENKTLFVFAAKQDRKTHQRLTFLPVSKAHRNKLYIFNNALIFH